MTSRAPLSVVRLSAWIAATVLLVAGLHLLGQISGMRPATLTANAVSVWADRPILMIAGVLRLLALVLAYLLLAVLVMTAVDPAADRRWSKTLRSTRVLAPLFALASVIIGVTDSPTPTGERSIETIRALTSIEMATDDTGEPDAAGVSTFDRSTAPADESPVVSSAASVDHPTDLWTVAPGDTFWSIAAEVIGDELGRAPEDDEIIPYWSMVIDANVDRLVDPGNPDLIYPDQEFVLPPVPDR